MHRSTLFLILSLLGSGLLAPPAEAQLPSPLPPPPAPSNNPVTADKAALGKALFWDEQLSSSRTVACGTCHQAASGGSDPRSRPASSRARHPGADGIAGTADDVLGSPGVVLRDGGDRFEWSGLFGLTPQVTPRLAASHINAAYAPWVFWDGRANGLFIDPVSGDIMFLRDAALESQVLEPPVSSNEMGHVRRDWLDVVARVASTAPLALATVIPPDVAAFIAGRTYPELFAAAFGTPEINASRIAMAIATYERTQFSIETPFDSLLAGDPRLTLEEMEGQGIFSLRCSPCHTGAVMTDQAFHYTGVRPASDDSGRFLVGRRPEDLGAFRTPSLRNVALRPALMHDGRFTTLAQVVDFYDRGGDYDAPNKDERIVPLHLSAGQKAALVAFLGRPLTDPRVAASSAPFDRPQLYAESARTPRVLAGGVPGSSGQSPAPVALEPAITGNSSFTVGVYAALGGALAVLVVDDQVPPMGRIPSTASFALRSIVLAGAGTSGGYGSVTLSIPPDASLQGRVLYGRWYVIDPGAVGGVAASAPFQFQIFGPQGAGFTAPLPPVYGAGVALAAPNPFRTWTAFRFDLDRATRLSVSVYDVGGRRVRQILDRPTAMPGTYAISWDGRDDAGREAGAGAYFYRVETESGERSGRVVRVR